MKTLLAFISFILALAYSQVPPAVTPRYPAGAEPPKAMPAAPKNLDFHEGSEDGVPAGWFVPKALRTAGYGAGLSKTGCKTEICAVVTTPPSPSRSREPEQWTPGMLFGNLMQTFDAEAYQGKTIRLRASIRLEPSSARDTAQMWLRVDCEQNRMCGFDNMGDRPVRSDKWKQVEIKVKVPRDAVKINIGLMSLGHGRAWIDEITLESTK